jgi:hypothetical protein
VLDRAVGEYRLPDGWSVYAAGTREGDRAVISRLSSALANRFVHLVFEPDLDDWLRWGEAGQSSKPESLGRLCQMGIVARFLVWCYTASFSSFAGRKAIFLLALIWMVSPVAGLRPIRAARF